MSTAPRAPVAATCWANLDEIPKSPPRGRGFVSGPGRAGPAADLVCWERASCAERVDYAATAANGIFQSALHGRDMTSPMVRDENGVPAAPQRAEGRVTVDVPWLSTHANMQRQLPFADPTQQTARQPSARCRRHHLCSVVVCRMRDTTTTSVVLADETSSCPRRGLRGVFDAPSRTSGHLTQTATKARKDTSWYLSDRGVSGGGGATPSVSLAVSLTEAGTKILEKSSHAVPVETLSLTPAHSTTPSPHTTWAT